MDTKINAIKSRIEQSSLPLLEKEKIFSSIDWALHQTVKPILAKHLPQDKLEMLENNPQKVMLDTYVQLIETAITDSTALSEINSAIYKLLIEIDALLTHEHI